MDESIRYYRNELSNKLKKTMRTNNTKEYWKILNSHNKNNDWAADIDDLYNFLKNLNYVDAGDTHTFETQQITRK